MSAGPVDLDMCGLVTKSPDSVNKLQLAARRPAVISFLRDLNEEVASVDNFFKQTIKTYVTKLDEIEAHRLASVRSTPILQNPQESVSVL